MRTGLLFGLTVVAAFAGLVSSSAAQPAGKKPAELTALLTEAAKYGGYENSFGKMKSDPVSIMFRSPGPKDADLEKLRSLLQKVPVPIGLNLNGCDSITDKGLTHLRDLRTIRELALPSNSITEEGLKNVATLGDLESLYLSSDSISDKWLVHIGKLTKLRKLSIYSKAITPAGYEHLAGLQELEEIHAGGIGQEIGDECLSHMKGMTKLKDLSIGGDKLSDAGMAHVKNFVELRKLRIDGRSVNAMGVANLAPLKKLQTLTVLSGPGFNGDALAALKDMSELRELELIYTPALDKAGGEHVGKLTGLKRLRIGHVGEGGLAGIAKLTGLEDLDLNYSFLNDDEMKYVSGLTGLKSLNLTTTRVTDAGLKNLVGLKKLSTLYLSGNNITDIGLGHIAGIPNVETVYLTDCKITGSGFKQLAKLDKLRELSISGNPVTDEHVMDLKDVRGLKEVSFTGTKVSEETALALKKARTDMRIRDIAGDEVSEKPVTRPRPKIEDLSKIEPAFRLTAEEFYKEYGTDKNKAAEKYKNKVIELTGEVDGMGRNFGSDTYISLKVEKQILGVMCFTADEQPWAKVVKGQKVKIKGKLPEFSTGTALIYCVFVETGEYAGIRISAEELAKEFAANPEETVKKYDKKQLVLTGEVEAKQFNSAGAAGIALKSGNKLKVKCSFTAFEKDLTKPIKVGQKITVVGEFTLNFPTSDEIMLLFCLPITTSEKPK